MALLCAPFGAAFAAVLCYIALAEMFGDRLGPAIGVLARWAEAFLAAPFLAAPMVFVALLLHLLLVAAGRRRWPAYAAAGILAGSALSPLLILPAGVQMTPSGWAVLGTFGAAFGVGGVFAFWIVLGPDRGPASRGEAPNAA